MAKFYYIKESETTYEYQSLPDKMKNIALQNFEKFDNGTCAVYIEWLQAEEFNPELLQITSHDGLLPRDYLILEFSSLTININSVVYVLAYITAIKERLLDIKNRVRIREHQFGKEKKAALKNHIVKPYTLTEEGWEDLSKVLTGSEARPYTELEELDFSQIKKGEKVEIRYEPNRSIIIHAISKDKIKVDSSNDKAIKIDDLLTFEKLRLHYPMHILSIERNNIIIHNCYLGMVSGITSMRKIQSA